MKMLFRTFLLLLPLNLLAAEAPAPAVEEAPVSDAGERPRIGLVLSGGGARGAAHIGVLKFLEEQQIPVDFVTGTSMGAVVGGLYASGMTAREIEEMTRSINWNDMFRDDLSPGELPIRRKIEGYHYLVDVEAGYRDGEVVFPTGFLRGQRLNLLLRDYTLPVRHIRDFDNLPTPFRAVATDLGTARPVIFREGDLVTAMRASMSVPGLLNPVEHEGTKLVDGGLVENLPIPTARELDPDVLIVVDVTTPLDDVDTLSSPFEVTSQVVNGIMLIQSRELRKQLDEQDLLISPDLATFTSASFDEVGSIIDDGYAAAQASREALRRFRTNPEDYAAYQRERRQMRQAEPVIVDISVQDKGQALEQLVRARVRQPLQAPLDTARLEEDLQHLYGMQLFDIVDYRVRPVDPANPLQRGDELVIETIPKETGPLRFELGFELVENFDGDTAFELSLATTAVNLNSLAAEWRTEIGLGEITGLTSEFYQPLSYDGSWFVSTHYTNALGNVFRSSDTGSIAEYRFHENVIGLDFGRRITASGAVRVGVRRGELNTTLRQGDPTIFGEQEFDVGDVVVSYRYDSMDSFSFPSSGTRVNLRWQSAQSGLGASSGGEYASLETLTAVNWFKDNLLLGVTMESAISGERFRTQGVALGGVTQLSGFERGELIGQHLALGRAIYYRYLGRDPDRLVDLPLYAGVTLEAGNVWEDSSDISGDDLVFGGSLFVALDTFLGPVGLAYGINSDGVDAFYLSIGTINGPSFRQFEY